MSKSHIAQVSLRLAIKLMILIKKNGLFKKYMHDAPHPCYVCAVAGSLGTGVTEPCCGYWELSPG